MMMKKSILRMMLISSMAVTMLFGKCKTDKTSVKPDPVDTTKKPDPEPVFSCTAPFEQNDYSIYPLTDDATPIGDVMPYFDEATNQFNVYFLKDIWNDAVQKRHPWYGIKTADFYSYSPLSAGEILSSSNQPCDQDYAIGTGSIIKSNATYYAFYTGHNPNYPSACVKTKEGVMLATSSSLNANFTKKADFTTIYAPIGEGYDLNDNFRDPYVVYDAATSKYYLIVAARKDVNGTFKGVIAYYASSNLTSWTYEGVLYDGGSDNFFMLETPEIFKSGSTWYLLFSDTNTKNVYYRKSTSITGPWSKPVGADRFEGNGIYAAKTAINNTGDRYIFGWTYVQENKSDAGAIKWGGNLVAHKLFTKANGDLAVSIPATQKAYLETQTHPVTKKGQRGTVTNTLAGTHSYNLLSQAESVISNVVFEPINLDIFKINATVSYTSSAKDFGFMIGACDGTNNFYSLRFVPSQNRFRLDKTSRSQLTTSTVATADVPINLSANTDYKVQIIIENSMLVVYINDEVALSTRVYKATNTSWGIFSDNSNATFSNITVNKP